jgi:hypothetical protein
MKTEWLLVSLIFGLVFPSCKSKSSVEEGAPASTGSAPASSAAVPHAIPDEAVQNFLNPKNQPAYSGPMGTVRGVIRVTGDEAPPVPGVAEKIKGANCEPARAMYGKLFREGPGRTLADVLVGVTGYEAFVPPEAETVSVTAKNCAYDRRTIAVTFGQSIEVYNRDRDATSYLPELVGAKAPALVVAMPGGSPVRLFPIKLDRPYVLRDNVQTFATADVFVLRFSTHDVTDLDGRYEIARVPAGDFKVSAHSPTLGKTVDKAVTVPAGGVVDVDFEIPFQAPKGAEPPK